MIAGEATIASVTITDEFLGTRTFPNTPLDMVKDQLRLLKHFRDDGRIPSAHLLDDIKVYEFIVHHADPVTAATQYARAMQELREKNFNATKREAVTMLGWSV